MLFAVIFAGLAAAAGVRNRRTEEGIRVPHLAIFALLGFLLFGETGVRDIQK